MAEWARTVAATATLLVAKNSHRIGLFITNQSAVDVFISVTSSVTITKGFTLAAGERYTETPEDVDREDYYWGDYYGIVATGTAAVAVVEQERQT